MKKRKDKEGKNLDKMMEDEEEEEEEEENEEDGTYIRSSTCPESLYTILHPLFCLFSSFYFSTYSTTMYTY